MPADAYDGKGNLADDPLLGSMQYDSENRLIQVRNLIGATTTYQYDGNGRRVMKVGSGNSTTYVYDAAGNLGAEYGSAGGADCATCYLTTDWLGSTRLITDANRVIAGQHDYLPFGEELLGSLGRQEVVNYGGPDNVAQRFTGKERDGESGSITLGRGTTGVGWGGSPVRIGAQNRSRFHTLTLRIPKA